MKTGMTSKRSQYFIEMFSNQSQNTVKSKPMTYSQIAKTRSPSRNSPVISSPVHLTSTLKQPPTNPQLISIITRGTLTVFRRVADLDETSSIMFSGKMHRIWIRTLGDQVATSSLSPEMSADFRSFLIAFSGDLTGVFTSSDAVDSIFLRLPAKFVSSNYLIYSLVHVSRSSQKHQSCPSKIFMQIIVTAKKVKVPKANHKL